jgi:DNA-directed RNA polymerase specialized sigma subunit
VKSQAERAERDRLVVKLALTDRLSTRAISRQMGVSTVRVNQILRKASYGRPG